MRRICLLLAIIAALPLAAAQDVLTIGKISATAGSSVTVPVYLRDVSGTALGADAGAGNRIQGIMLQVTATPAVAGMSMTFAPTGVLQGRTPLYQRSAGSGWIGSYSETGNPLPFNTGAAAPGDRIGTLFITVPAGLTGISSIALSFNPAMTMLSNEAGTVTESFVNRHLQLVNGSIALSGSATSTALASTPNPSLAGSAVTFTATITSPAAGAIGGSVIFKKGSQIIGSAIVQNGSATWNTSALSTGTHNISAVYEGDATHLPSVSNTVQQVVNITLTPPAGVVATATSATNIRVSWNASANATGYEVRRKPAGGEYAPIGTPAGTTFNDATALPGQLYFYVVRAVTPTLNSGDSAADYALAMIFTDDPLEALTTRVKLVHLTELRTAVNAFRAAAGLTAIVWNDPSPSIVKREHLEELRSGLQQARSPLGLPALTFTDMVPTTIKAVHFQELRAAVK